LPGVFAGFGYFKKIVYLYIQNYTIRMLKSGEIKQTKINQLMQSTPKGLVLLFPELVLGRRYPYELQQRYRTSGWLKSIGKGAMSASIPFVCKDKFILELEKGSVCLKKALPLS
jgi:hypothetical protein